MNKSEDMNFAFNSSLYPSVPNQTKAVYLKQAVSLDTPVTAERKTTRKSRKPTQLAFGHRISSKALNFAIPNIRRKKEGSSDSEDSVKTLENSLSGSKPNTAKQEMNCFKDLHKREPSNIINSGAGDKINKVASRNENVGPQHECTFKTELCNKWTLTGRCVYGELCRFAHGKDELKNRIRHPKFRTKICKKFSKLGYCPYESRCDFVHVTTKNGKIISGYADTDGKTENQNDKTTQKKVDALPSSRCGAKLSNDLNRGVGGLSLHDTKETMGFSDQAHGLQKPLNISTPPFQTNLRNYIFPTANTDIKSSAVSSPGYKPILPLQDSTHVSIGFGGLTRRHLMDESMKAGSRTITKNSFYTFENSPFHQSNKEPSPIYKQPFYTRQALSSHPSSCISLRTSATTDRVALEQNAASPYRNLAGYRKILESSPENSCMLEEETWLLEKELENYKKMSQSPSILTNQYFLSALSPVSQGRVKQVYSGSVDRMDNGISACPYNQKSRFSTMFQTKFLDDCLTDPPSSKATCFQPEDGYENPKYISKHQKSHW